MQTYDITNFMTWWVNNVINIITYCWNTLDSIQFAGTSILRIMIWCTILSALFKITLTIPQGITGNSERVKEDYIKYKNQTLKQKANEAKRSGLIE